MHTHSLEPWQHEHTFGQEAAQPGERRSLIVVGITGAMMVVEVAAGLAFGSMALLADGLHMASHAAALGIAAFAYIYARRRARDPRFSFGTGKVNALAGFAGAVLLAVFAMLMGWESANRFFHPVSIVFDQATLVAVIGLAVNGASVVILGAHEQVLGGRRGDPGDHAHHGNQDHNLRSAYLHVLADALTSLLAIFALLSGKYLGLTWMDPLMGIVGMLLVSQWSWGLVRATGRVLLDREGPALIRGAIKESIERHDGNRVADLHVWSIGPDIYAAIVSVVTHYPKSASYYKELIPEGLRVAHISVEVYHCTPAAVNASRGPSFPG